MLQISCNSWFSSLGGWGSCELSKDKRLKKYPVSQELRLSKNIEIESKSCWSNLDAFEDAESGAMWSDWLNRLGVDGLKFRPSFERLLAIII